jgi:hypothetical protein
VASAKQQNITRFDTDVLLEQGILNLFHSDVMALQPRYVQCSRKI